MYELVDPDLYNNISIGKAAFRYKKTLIVVSIAAIILILNFFPYFHGTFVAKFSSPSPSDARGYSPLGHGLGLRMDWDGPTGICLLSCVYFFYVFYSLIFIFLYMLLY